MQPERRPRQRRRAPRERACRRRVTPPDTASAGRSPADTARRGNWPHWRSARRRSRCSCRSPRSVRPASPTAIEHAGGARKVSGRAVATPRSRSPVPNSPPPIQRSSPLPYAFATGSLASTRQQLHRHSPSPARTAAAPPSPRGSARRPARRGIRARSPRTTGRSSAAPIPASSAVNDPSRSLDRADPPLAQRARCIRPRPSRPRGRTTRAPSQRPASRSRLADRRAGQRAGHVHRIGIEPVAAPDRRRRHPRRGAVGRARRSQVAVMAGQPDRHAVAPLDPRQVRPMRGKGVHMAAKTVLRRRRERWKAMRRAARLRPSPEHNVRYPSRTSTSGTLGAAPARKVASETLSRSSANRTGTSKVKLAVTAAPVAGAVSSSTQPPSATLKRRGRDPRDRDRHAPRHRPRDPPRGDRRNAAPARTASRRRRRCRSLRPTPPNRTDRASETRAPAPSARGRTRAAPRYRLRIAPALL